MTLRIDHDTNYPDDAARYEDARGDCWTDLWADEFDPTDYPVRWSR